MKVYFLDYGWLEGDYNWMVNLSTYGTKENKIAFSRWEKFPEYGVLIETEKGYILYDTGSHPGDYDKSSRFPYYFRNEQGVEKQLSLLGLKPSDIHTVIISHLHDDHCGCLPLFRHAHILIDKDEYEYVQNARAGLIPLRGAYKRMTMDYPDIELVDSDRDFSDFIRIYRLPGHSHGLLGLLIRFSNRCPLFIISDASNTEENYRPQSVAAAGLHNEDLYFQSLEKVREIEKKTNAEVIFGHDMRQFSLLKKCPEFYGDN